MVGKWHLDPNHSDRAFLDRHGVTGDGVPPELLKPYHPRVRGFQETFDGQLNRYSGTYDLQGNRFKHQRPVMTEGDRLDRQSDAAVTFIDLHHRQPFFLYVAYFGPHVPLASSPPYLDRFKDVASERRRHALAMIAAIDDGVARIVARLEKAGIDDDTLIVFASDNGAPLKLTMPEDPMDKQAAHWNGSKNTPLAGEKGMLSEGGIRVPMVARWKGRIREGQVCSTPVTTLDIAATVCAVAGLGVPANFDGVDLVPMLADGDPLPERTLHWRFWNQSAARRGPWKLLTLGSRTTYLFNVVDDIGEKNDVAGAHPEIVADLERSLADWAATLSPAGLSTGEGNAAERAAYANYFNLPQPK
jgi:arylsulfatase A-like enzyme